MRLTPLAACGILVIFLFISGCTYHGQTQNPNPTVTATPAADTSPQISPNLHSLLEGNIQTVSTPPPIKRERGMSCKYDTDCRDPLTCTRGVCVAEYGEPVLNRDCEIGNTNCFGQCVDVHTDSSNCGSCGITLKEGFRCLNGHPAGKSCSGDGDCGKAEFCLQGNCSYKLGPVPGETVTGTAVSVCQAGYTPCWGTCVNLMTDPENCGSCGAHILMGYECVNGKAVGKSCTTDADCGGTTSCSAGRCTLGASSSQA